VHNSLCVQVLRSPILAALLHGSRAVGASQTLRRGIFTRQGGHPVRHWAVELSGFHVSLRVEALFARSWTQPRRPSTSRCRACVRRWSCGTTVCGRYLPLRRRSTARRRNATGSTSTTRPSASTSRRSGVTARWTVSATLSSADETTSRSAHLYCY